MVVELFIDMAKRPYEIPEGALEKVVKEKVKRFFKDNDIWFKMPQPGTFGANNGTADFQALHKSLFIAVETKANRKDAKPTQHQIDYLDKVNACGGLGVIVKCEQDILDLQANLKERGLI